MAEFAIFGATGFIGRHLSQHLARQGHMVRSIGRDQQLPRGTSLRHAVYCIGLTADFRSRPNATAEAHVGVLADVLDRYRYDSFLYLSSTRIYAGAAAGYEDTPLLVRPQNPDHLYNLTKLAGEALCLAQAHPAVRVGRISNVVGAGAEPSNFIPSIIEEAVRTGKVVLRTAPQSAKDYVDVADVCAAIEAIALRGAHRLYNIGSGVQTTNVDVAELLARSLGADVSFAADAPAVVFPPIDVHRLRDEFGLAARPFATSLLRLVQESRLSQALT